MEATPAHQAHEAAPTREAEAHPQPGAAELTPAAAAGPAPAVIASPIDPRYASQGALR